MATPDELRDIRNYTNELTDAKFSDQYLGELVDANGVVGAAAIVWDQKAAEAAELVNVSEAGASHAYGTMYKAALEMATYYRGQVAAADPSSGSPVVRVKKIVRS